MWTRKGGLMFFFGIVSLIFGLIIADFQLVLLAFMIFTFFFVVVILPRPQVQINKTVTNNTMFENGEARVVLNMQKTKPGYGTVELYDRIPVYSELNDGLNSMIYNPPPSQILEYYVTFPLRGYYSIGPTSVRISDHFNLFYHDQKLIDKEPISVFPHIVGMKDFKFKSKKNIHYPGDFLTLQAGSSNEFYHIRDYIKGDPFKKINWKVFARKRELMINEYEKENICDSFIFIDARAVSNIGTITENTLEYNIKLALALSHFLIMRRNQVGVVVYNDRIQMVPPKPGIRQFNEILSFLTGIYPRGWVDLYTAVQHANTYLKSKTTVIIFSNLEYDNSLLTAIQNLAAMDYHVIIISPSPTDFELKAAAFNGSLEKVELFKMSRQNFISELRGVGVSVIEFGLKENINDILDSISKEILR
jgi:uncharacterized protein (DUF58 family)